MIQRQSQIARSLYVLSIYTTWSFRKKRFAWCSSPHLQSQALTLEVEGGGSRVKVKPALLTGTVSPKMKNKKKSLPTAASHDRKGDATIL
jgi:hypothetical protein